MPRLAKISDSIDALLDGIASGDRPQREQLEEALTDGYAIALGLEAECARVERRISAQTERLAEGSNAESARELSALAGSLICLRRERDTLRARLAVLQDGVRRARVA
jgi:predicted  nucleic acid-binding Zn-ribbon protein